MSRWTQTHASTLPSLGFTQPLCQVLGDGTPCKHVVFHFEPTVRVWGPGLDPVLIRLLCCLPFDNPECVQCFTLGKKSTWMNVCKNTAKVTGGILYSKEVFTMSYPKKCKMSRDPMCPIIMYMCLTNISSRHANWLESLFLGHTHKKKVLDDLMCCWGMWMSRLWVRLYF